MKTVLSISLSDAQLLLEMTALILKNFVSVTCIIFICIIFCHKFRASVYEKATLLKLYS